MAVITISRQSDSGGDEIATRVAEVLQYRLFNKAMVEAAASEAGLSAQEALRFADYYRVERFLDRLFRGDFYRLWSEDRTPDLTDREAQTLFQKAIETARQIDNVIIVGRGGQAMLQDQSGVMHVRIVAPMELRIQKVSENSQLDAGQARELLLARDKASADYVRNVFGRDWTDPCLYHLVLNTGKLEHDTAVRLLVEAAHVILGMSK
jgi:cytidylate kinase